MWREVPHHLLPTITASSPIVSLPRSIGLWRLQAQADGYASAWQDAPSDQSSVNLNLLPAKDFRFTVTADGTPLEDSRFYLLRARRVGPAEPLGFEVSDPEGVVAVTLPATDRSAAIVSHDSRSAEPFPALRDVPPLIELGQGLTVSGQAINESDQPVAAARLRGMSFIPNGFGLMQRHLGRSRPDGRFEISGFSLGSASLQTMEANLAFSTTFELTGSVDIGAIILTAKETSWVQVVDSGNATPIRAARIRESSGQWTDAGEDGLAKLSLDFARNIIVKAKGYLLTQFDLPKRAGMTAEEPFVIGLEPSFAVEGVFVAADGNTPAAGGQASATSLTSGLIMQNAISPDGAFALDLPAGAYALELTAGNAGFLRLEVQGIAGELRSLGIVSAPASAWVRGYVVDENDYTPVSKASVSYKRPSQFGPLLASAMGRSASVATNAEGYFELFGLELGSATLRVQADGFAPLKLNVEASTSQGIDVGVVELSHGRRVTIRSDVDEGMVVLDSGRTGLMEDRLTGKLDEGTSTFTSVPDGPFGVLVYENSLPVCEEHEVDAAGDEVITCNHNATRVTGSVTRGAQPGGGMLVWRRGSESQLPEGGITYGSGPLARTEDLVSTRTIELQATLASDGRYSLPAVLPGEWEVIWAPLSGGTQDVRSVEVPRVREAVLDFRYDGISIEGLVLDPDGHPATLANVTVFPSRRTVSTDQNGRFEILGLDPGLHRLRARRQHLRSTLVEAELRDSNDREVVQLLLEDDPPSEELVITISGSGSGFCLVEMDSSALKVVRVAAGVARVLPEPPLSANLRVACRTEGRWILDGWRSLRQALDHGLDFDSFDSNSSIILAGESPTATVQIIGPGGWDLGELRLWFDATSSFPVGETIANLPVGEYVVRARGQSQSVWTERRRATKVEIGGH